VKARSLFLFDVEVKPIFQAKDKQKSQIARDGNTDKTRISSFVLVSTFHRLICM
jgi:hypothetical protein